jgi:hypothetical protein
MEIERRPWMECGTAASQSGNARESTTWFGYRGEWFYLDDASSSDIIKRWQKLGPVV